MKKTAPFNYITNLFPSYHLSFLEAFKQKKNRLGILEFL